MTSKLKRSIVAAIIGRTAVGKSSIINTLTREHLSIVSSKTQTTRQLIRAIFSYKDCQIVLVDTPGYQERPKNKLNRLMNRSLSSAIANPDMIIWVVDASKYLKFNLVEDRLIKKLLIPLINHSDLRITSVVVLNKIDKLKNLNQILPIIEKLQTNHPLLVKSDLIPISAKTKKNINVLNEFLYKNSTDIPPIFPEDQISDLSESYFASEFMRESLFNELFQELPFGCVVTTDKFSRQKIKIKKTTKRLINISLTINISNKNHKPIILGEKGIRLKKIATNARIKMENFFKTKVYLQTWIKIAPNWQNKPELLKEYGYL